MTGLKQIEFECALVVDFTDTYDQGAINVAGWEDLLFSTDATKLAQVRSLIWHRRLATFNDVTDVVNYPDLVAHCATFCQLYESINTGIKLSVPTSIFESRPTCVRYVWVDGRLEPRYNYGLDNTGDVFSLENDDKPSVHLSFACKRPMTSGRY